MFFPHPQTQKTQTLIYPTTNIWTQRSHFYDKSRKMSVASSIPCIRIPNPSSPSPCSSSSSSTATTTSSCLRLSTASSKPYLTIRSSQAEGPVRRPVAPPLREPAPPSPTPPLKPKPPPTSSFSSSSPVAPLLPKPASSQVVVEDKNVVTLEFQRQKAKELQEYFKQKKIEESNQGPFFGFIGKNEIANGRWAMFGFAVGMLTEYATGSDFVDQVKILLSNFGILDLE